MLTTTPTVLDERAWQELVDALTRRKFGIGAGMAAVATLLSSCSSSDGSGTSDDTQMRTVTTPLGTYDIPTNPKRVLAVDARTDLELAIALELPVFGYNISPATEWFPSTDRPNTSATSPIWSRSSDSHPISSSAPTPTTSTGPLQNSKPSLLS